MRKDAFLYDEEERKLMEEIEKGEWVDAPLDKESYAESAAYTKALQEKRQTTIRFSVSDLAIVKARAKEMGVGYQNIIQALVHNYAKGKITLEL